MARAMARSCTMPKSSTDGAKQDTRFTSAPPFSPALTLNGIAGGHYGPGVKGVIPASAVVKLSFRLVPDQDPERIGKLFRAHIARIAPPGVDVAVKIFSPIQPALVDRKHPAVRPPPLLIKKYLELFQSSCVLADRSPSSMRLRNRLVFRRCSWALGCPMTASTRPTRNFTCQTSTAVLRLQSGISSQPPPLYNIRISQL